MLYNVIQYYINIKFEMYVWIYFIREYFLNIFICEFDNSHIFFLQIFSIMYSTYIIFVSYKDTCYLEIYYKYLLII